MKKHVVVYSTPDCAFCKTEKQWLTSKGIEYDEVLLTDDPERLYPIVERLSGQRGVPVTAIWNEEKDKDNTLDTVVVGFQRDKLSEALGI